MNPIVSRETFTLLLAAVLDAEKIAVDDSFGDKMWLFYETLTKWNKTHKLTANSDMENFITKQVVDSLLFTKVDATIKGKKFLDFGSGGGFPGLPLAVHFRDEAFTLSDVIRKKTSFLSFAKALVNAENVDVFTGDALTIPRLFDYIFLKAVSREKEFISSLTPLLSEKGAIILYHAPSFVPDVPENLTIKQTVFDQNRTSAVSVII